MSAVAERRRTGRTVSAVLVGALMVASVAAIAGGLLTAGLAMWGRGTAAEAPVQLAAPVGFYGDLTLPCVEGWSLDGAGCEPAASPDQWPGGQPLPVRHAGGFLAGGGVLQADPFTALFATAAAWGGFLAGGVVGLVLIPLLRTTASGRPFAAGNDRRLAIAAGVIAAGWALASVGDFVAASRIIELLELTPVQTAAGSFDVPSGWLAPELQVTWWPLPIVLLLTALAAATRRGARLASDTEGLV